MDEPPILSDEAASRPQNTSVTIVPADVNPYAASDEVGPGVANAQVDLPLLYWVVWVVALILFIAVAFATNGIVLPGLIALVAAAVRVPLLQLRLSRRVPQRPLPRPLLLLLTSWAFMLIAGFAAGAAFVAVCIPSGLIVLSSNQGADASVQFVLAISGLASLAAYIMLFLLSLRLPV